MISASVSYQTSATKPSIYSALETLDRITGNNNFKPLTIDQIYEHLTSLKSILSEMSVEMIGDLFETPFLTELSSKISSFYFVKNKENILESDRMVNQSSYALKVGNLVLQIVKIVLESNSDFYLDVMVEETLMNIIMATRFDS